MEARQEGLRRRLRELGFDEVRFVRLVPGPGAVGLRAWLDAGYHADMGWMERTAAKRLDPGLVLDGARSAVLLGVNYFQGDSSGGAGEAERPPGGPVWARYSLYRDYHDSLKTALERAGGEIEAVYGAAPADYRYYVDTGPVLERAWAALAGVGFIGKNAMLISRRHGNWLFLAAILTRLDLRPDRPLRGRGDPGSVGQLCGKCTRCLDACPTKAFPAPGVVDARRCISYQTIENKGIIPLELRPAIGNRIYGCDTCLDVCPWNRFARAGRQMILSSRRDIAGIALREILELTPGRFAQVFRGTAIKRIKLAGLLRNACVAAGNSADRSLVEVLARLASHASPVVRAHAVWAARRLGAAERLARVKGSESDPAVLAEYASDPGDGSGASG
ncbi:MAG TPA: tRNA epoxyqueuosine(34) reductase QueG [Opitutaceae bacterium]|nr:tRNA epoxyqueuosine(34) reductase QueG [Opitutaceae bacterium]